jgi:hypothetical protein
MSTPLVVYTGVLCMMAPLVAQGVYVDQAQFAYMARSAVRLLSLNISFLGGIHYGLGACNWEIALKELERTRATRQMIFSFLPALVAIMSSSYLLFAAPIQMHHIISCFTGLMVTQFGLLKADGRAVELNMAPVWFKKFRQRSFIAYMIMTTLIFGVYYQHKDEL